MADVILTSVFVCIFLCAHVCLCFSNITGKIRTGVRDIFGKDRILILGNIGDILCYAD